MRNVSRADYIQRDLAIQSNPCTSFQKLAQKVAGCALQIFEGIGYGCSYLLDAHMDLLIWTLNRAAEKPLSDAEKWYDKEWQKNRHG